MRVEVVIDSLTWGGAEMLLGDLAAGVRAAGIDLGVTHLFSHDENPAAARLRARGVEPVHVPASRFADPAAVGRLRAHLAARRPDVVHTHLQYSDLLGSLAARRAGIPAVSTIHVMEWSDSRDRLRQRVVSAVRRRCAAKVICVSDAARAAFLDAGWDRAERVVTVRNGVVDERSGGGPALRAELGIGSGDVVVSMLAVLREGKGHEAAIEAVARLRERIPRLCLLIAGEGPERPVIEGLAAERGCAVLAGHRDDVGAVLDASDVLLHPSRVDALPTALIEAMRAGVPVVATAVGGIPEIVEDGVQGALMRGAPTSERVEAALEQVLGDDDAREQMGRAGRTRFEREFTAERWAERLGVVYEAVAG